jgi:hypothetical protein
MGIVISFPMERCSVGPSPAQGHDRGSVIILPVIRVERHVEAPTDNSAPSTSSPRGKRRKR